MARRAAAQMDDPEPEPVLSDPQPEPEPEPEPELQRDFESELQAARQQAAQQARAEVEREYAYRDSLRPAPSAPSQPAAVQPPMSVNLYDLLEQPEEFAKALAPLLQQAGIITAEQLSRAYPWMTRQIRDRVVWTMQNEARQYDDSQLDDMFDATLVQVQGEQPKMSTRKQLDEAEKRLQARLQAMGFTRKEAKEAAADAAAGPPAPKVIPKSARPGAVADGGRSPGGSQPQRMRVVTPQEHTAEILEERQRDYDKVKGLSAIPDDMTE